MKCPVCGRMMYHWGYTAQGTPIFKCGCGNFFPTETKEQVMSDEKPEPKSFPLRMKEVFHNPQQPLQEFMAEIKQLTDKDKADLRQWFNEIGMPVS